MNELLGATADYVRTLGPIEAGALLSGIAYVILAAREKLICWPIGIVASILAMFIAFQSNYRLDVLKESYYVVMGFYGWYAWSARGKSQDGQGGPTAKPSGVARPIVSYPASRMMIIIAAGIVLSVALGFGFSRLGSSLPYLDAGTTVFSFLTTWLVTQKVLQNWLFWIVINAVSFYMYMVNGFLAFSSLMLVYLAVAVFGYFRWRRQYYLLERGPRESTGQIT